MGVKGILLQVPESLPMTWWKTLNIPDAFMESAHGILTARRQDAVVSVFQLTLRDGVRVIAVQYKEFWRRRPDNEHLKNEIAERLMALGAKRFDSRRKRD